MYNICIFAGTTEGRRLAEFLSTQPVQVTACVATEYGEALLPSADNITVSAERLDADDMQRLFARSQFDLVIDATHPYAERVTRTLLTTCQSTDTRYLRLLREQSGQSSEAVYVADAKAAAEFLNGVQGNILLTTGSKEIMQYRGICGFASRVYARVLPMQASLQLCADAGLNSSHIIAMQGPFSEDMNISMLRYADAVWLVTKDGGETGGFEAKLSAAAKTGARLVVIGRPAQQQGVSLSETIDILCSQFGCTYTPRVDILGIGPGSIGSMTGEARDAVRSADCLIGAKRMLQAVAAPGQRVYDAISPADIADFIASNRQYRHFAVAMSGDVGFFSGAKKLLPLLENCDVRLLPGISSLVYLCAKLKTSYDDIFIASLHGRSRNIAADVRANSRVFVLVGGKDGINALCDSLINAGLGQVKISVGQRLSYPDEKIVQGTAQQLSGGVYEPLSVALIENDNPDVVVTHGLPDSVFMRGEGADGVVPMTKSEVRAVCLSKLRLTDRSVCWDIGAGTGSVSVEMALMAKKGRVYAIERKAAAVELLQHNKQQFMAENLEIISGCAPQACENLPAPSHAFIGGSSGNMRDIIRLLIDKNPEVRIVATAIALESVAELTGCINEFPFIETEVISMQIARDKKAGPYHLMTANNPIYIFTMQAGGAKR